MERRPTEYLQPIEGFVYHELDLQNRQMLGDNADCSICLTEFRNGNLVVQTRCGHHYHYVCLIRAMTRSSVG